MMLQSYIFQRFWRCLPLPGKNINNSFADARRKIEEGQTLPGIPESKKIAAHNISCSVTHMQAKKKDLNPRHYVQYLTNVIPYFVK